MRRVGLALVFLATVTVARAAEDIKVVHDPRPDAGVPREALSAGTMPDTDAAAAPGSNVSFRRVTDLKDYGPLRNVIAGTIQVVSVRYHDGLFKDLRDVQTYLAAVLRSDKGTTNAYCPWAEALPPPAVEATVQFTSGATGKWLLWRQGRSVYRDPDLKWWFTYGW